MNGIKVVIGSWGSYNECNERALGSKWLDLSDYSDWDEIVEELKKEGFELDGIHFRNTFHLFRGISQNFLCSTKEGLNKECDMLFLNFNSTSIAKSFKLFLS